MIDMHHYSLFFSPCSNTTTNITNTDNSTINNTNTDNSSIDNTNTDNSTIHNSSSDNTTTVRYIALYIAISECASIVIVKYRYFPVYLNGCVLSLRGVPLASFPGPGQLSIACSTEKCAQGELGTRLVFLPVI